MGYYMVRQATEERPAHWQPVNYGQYILIEEWQEHDVDTLEEWEYAELAMEHYILKGRGENAYKEYWK
jgi:hypothetical protein